MYMCGARLSGISLRVGKGLGSGAARPFLWTFMNLAPRRRFTGKTFRVAQLCVRKTVDPKDVCDVGRNPDLGNSNGMEVRPSLVTGLGSGRGLYSC